MSMMSGANGQKSSKRIIGTSCIGYAAFMGVVLFYKSIGADPISDSSTALDIIKTAFTAGTVLLGVGVAELFSKNK